MKLPKVVFKPMTLKDNIEIIKWAFYEDNDVNNVRNYALKYMPELSKIENGLSKEETYERITSIVKRKYEHSEEEINDDVKRYDSLWKEYNDKYFEMMSKYFDIAWPSMEEIEVTVGLIPVFPRNINTFSFSIGVGLDEASLLRISAHETLHFMWFEKWRQIHPETSKEEYECPNIVWQYSEMVTDPILNNKPFRELFSNLFDEKGYDSFYELYDGETLVMDELKSIYNENVSIEEKMNKGFNYIKRICEEKIV